MMSAIPSRHMSSRGTSQLPERRCSSRRWPQHASWRCGWCTHGRSSAFSARRSPHWSRRRTAQTCRQHYQVEIKASTLTPTLCQHHCREPPFFIAVSMAAPSLTLMQTSAVLAVLNGRSAGWGVQRRTEAGASALDVMRMHRWHTACGAALNGDVLGHLAGDARGDMPHRRRTAFRRSNRARKRTATSAGCRTVAPH